MQKKGALELSITTIVVVVIGVTILTLGLVFVKGMFDKLGGTTTKIFQQTDTIIDTMTIDSKYSGPSSVEVKQGEMISFTVTVGHDGTVGGDNAIPFVIAVSPSGGTPVKGLVVSVISDKSVNLKPAQQATYTIGVKADTDAVLDSNAYSISITAGGEDYEARAVIVKVIQKGGLF